MKKEIKQGGGSICGGIVSESQHRCNMKIDIWLDTMAYVMPDKQYVRYLAYEKKGDKKMARKIFEKYAYSQI